MKKRKVRERERERERERAFSFIFEIYNLYFSIFQNNYVCIINEFFWY